MKSDNKISLFLVDDDALFVKLLAIELLANSDFGIETHASGELCIENLSHNPDIIILDYHLNSIDAHAMNGIETLIRIKEINPNIPVVILSSVDKMEVALACMQHTAFDYIMKSETAFIRLPNIIRTIVHYKNMEKELLGIILLIEDNETLA